MITEEIQALSGIALSEVLETIPTDYHLSDGIKYYIQMLTGKPHIDLSQWLMVPPLFLGIQPSSEMERLRNRYEELGLWNQPKEAE